MKRGNRAGSSRNESGYSRRGTQTSFPFLESRSCENFGLAHFLIFLLEKKKLNRAPILINCQYSDYKMSQSEIVATATLEKRETDLGTSPRVVRLIPRRAGSISSLYGAITNLKAKKALFVTPQKSPPEETALE